MGRVSAVIGSLFALVCCGALMLAPGASAQQIVVGQTAPPSSPPISCEEDFSYVEFQSSLATGSSYVFPSAGLVTSWSVMGGSSGSQAFGVKILRPVVGNTYKVVGGEVGFSLQPGVLNTFPLSVQVEAGDILGIQFYGYTAPCVFQTGLSGDQIRWDQRIAMTNSTFSFDPDNVYSGFRTNISATLLPPPTVSLIAPAKGSIKGDRVVIYGTNFADVRSVKFGDHYAKSFTVESEGQITAFAPSTFKLEKKLPLSVTTGAGVATGAQTYSYVGCKVPSLTGKKLKPAKRALKRASCKLGKVTKLEGATARTGHVLRQHPSPGTIRSVGTRVKLTLAP
jgi:PASTA domain-containing protein/IPT/TIG domain-containing protein